MCQMKVYLYKSKLLWEKCKYLYKKKVLIYMKEKRL